MSNTNLPRVPKALTPSPVSPQRRRLLIALALIVGAVVGGRAITRRVVDAPARGLATPR